MKRCAKCGYDKSVDEFVRDKSRKDGRYPYCKACHRAVVKGYGVQYTEQAKAAGAERRRKRDACEEARSKYLLGSWVYSLKRRYGITVDDYLAMAEAQQGRCGICGSPPDPSKRKGQQGLHVDHCHTTGVVRGLLCFSCNAALGMFKDDAAMLEKALAYLNA